MTDHRKLSVSLILALGTFALVGSMALVGLINTARWLASLPPEADLSTLPPQIVLGVLKLVLQFLACLVGFFCAVYATRKFALRSSSIAIGVLLLLHIASWLFGPATLGTSFLAQYGVRIGVTVWLIALFIALVPNNSFKPNPLRGSA
jgi:hypothetical protein